MMYQDKKDSVEVLTLPFSQTIPTPLISSWPSGPIESYAHTIGFRYQATTPKEVTASMILELRPGGLKAFNLIVGGPVSTPIIPFQTLLGLEGRTAGGPESKFSVKIDPAEISFITNRSISEFVPIADLFRGSLTHAGVAMSWTEGAGVYARFRLAMEQSPATLIMSTKLVLEAAVFEDGYVLPSLGEPVKMAIEKSSSSAIPLWETPVAWHRPLADFSLMTTPGINYYATNGLACTDPQLRWGMSWAVNECKKGKAITTATEWTEYIKNPIPTYPPGPTRHSFVVTFSPDPVFLPQNSETGNVHKAAGMPTPEPHGSLRNNVQAAMSDMQSMRHQGPQPEGTSPPFLGAPEQLASTGYQPGSNPVIHSQTTVPQAPAGTILPSQASAHQPPAEVAPGPTLYTKYCSKCSWHSILTTDASAYGGAVSDLDFHMKEAHPEAKDTGEFSTKNKETEEYKLATTLREVQACQDDGVNNLCPVRFWSSPISWKSCQLALPLEQTPVCALREFEPWGLEVNNRKLIRDIHSLGLKSPKLSDFSDDNLKVVPSQQDTFVGLEKGNSGRIYTKKVLKEITTTKEAIKAVSNYRELMRMIHPLYSGPQILFKVLFEKYLLGVATADIIDKFFGSVTFEQASRAARNELPYTYQELLTKWDTSYRGRESSLDQKEQDKKVMEAWKRAGGTLPPNRNSPKKARFGSWCVLFNTNTGCTNTQRGGGCIDQAGAEFKHGCNVRAAGGRMCNSAQHNRFKH